MDKIPSNYCQYLHTVCYSRNGKCLGCQFECLCAVVQDTPDPEDIEAHKKPGGWTCDQYRG